MQALDDFNRLMLRKMMMRTLVSFFRPRSVVIIAAGVLLACSIPTENVCGCPPAVSTFMITGEVRNRDGALVQGAVIESAARLATSADTVGARSELVSGSPTRTDASGAFRARLLSASAPGALLPRVRVVNNANRDTTPAFAGLVRFAGQGTPIDSLRLTVALP